MTQYKTALQVNYGTRILPIKRVETFSADEWEEFIEEWLDVKTEDYIEIERLGGAGDKGRDIVAYISDKTQTTFEWDCYQCKHYDNPIMPTQVYVEIGKILYYTFNRDYPIPQNYYFISPKGCGTSLSKLLQNASEFKEKIIDNWVKYCESEITNFPIKLEGEFEKYVRNFNFKIFSKIQTKEIIKEHTKHKNHLIRFGGGLPERSKITEKDIPESVTAIETIYVNQLMLAYTSDCGEIISSTDELTEKTIYLKHFNRARLCFHHAEQLRNFSRDSLPPETFNDLQDEIYSSIIDIVEEDYESAFVKVKDAEKEARRINISSNPLKDVSIINDKSGICHQLVNDGKIKWIEDGE